jgi:hypothetical protein
MKELAKELVKIAKEVNKTAAFNGGIMCSDKTLDFIYHPFQNMLQIGLGGEWWVSEKIKMGFKNILEHNKKNSGDPVYAEPVIVTITDKGNHLLFEIEHSIYNGSVSVSCKAGVIS